MADQKKLTTQEILALARKKASGGESVPETVAESTSAGTTPADTTPATESPAEEPAKTEAAKPATAPKSTADILAAARAQMAAKSADTGESTAKPTSTADILAAARAQKAGAAATPAASAPKSTADILAAARAAKAAPAADKSAAAEKSPVIKKTPVADLGDKPAIKDMVAAVKQSQSGGSPPKLPVKPVAAQPKLPPKKVTSRRRFLEALAVVAITPFALGWAAVGGIGTLWTLGMARFMMPNMVLELPSQFKVGLPSEFPPGVVSEKYKASRGVWVVNSDEYGGKSILYALLSICTHLGCTPNWLSGEQKFKCPCHGSGFYITGINFEGPAPRPLERVGLRISEDGSLEVDKSLKFQEELGQWSDPKSFVEIV